MSELTGLRDDVYRRPLATALERLGLEGTTRTPVEEPSVGVLLSESRSGPIVEFTL